MRKRYPSESLPELLSLGVQRLQVRVLSPRVLVEPLLVRELALASRTAKQIDIPFDKLNHSPTGFPCWRGRHRPLLAVKANRLRMLSPSRRRPQPT